MVIVPIQEPGRQVLIAREFKLLNSFLSRLLSSGLELAPSLGINTSTPEVLGVTYQV
jgi:hypothetical protein